MKAISFIRKAIAGVWVASAFCLATGCGGEGSGPKYRIGISQPSDDYWRQKSNEDIERGAMFHENVELDFRSANNNSGRQREDVEKFIEEGCDLIILSPHDATDIMPTVRKAREKGIPVVTFDRTLDGDDFTAHLEVDNYALAKSVGEYALTVMDRPIRALEIQGPPDSSPAIRRHKGFSDAMAASPGTEIVASVSAMWQDSLAYALADSILALHPEINLIYAHTDYMALGAEKAARERGRDDITVLGIDGVPHIGIRGVRDGRLTATFLYPTEGERLMALAVNILEGKPYDRINLTPPLPPIDRTNAEIMLAQDSLLNLETDRIKLMRGKLHEYLDRNTAQRLLLYAVLIIALLLGVVTFVSLRAVAIYRRQRAALEERNVRLKEEKAKQQVLYNRLEEATQSKLTFFTNVSHDLRTPLTLVAGPVEEMAHADYLTPRHNSLMQTARRNVNILRRLIDQILDFRKYENGKADLHLSEVDAGRLIRLWTDDFMEAGRRRDIKISCTISPEGGIVCAMDVEKLERVFFNLMSNALKHTPDNGRIHVDCRSGGDTLTISVSDTGIGISPEDQTHIFDRFFQAHRSVPFGSGIGLAVTKAFIELHGGTIEVKSEPGKGSVFTVTLPLRHCAAAEQETPDRHIRPEDIATELGVSEDDSRSFDKEKPLLLIIDDNRDIRSMISDLLGEEYNIICASDGQQGVKMAVKYVPDIIICDVMMPVMDGLECVKRLREEVSTSHIPVLMLTACSLDSQRVAGYESGVDAYLPKPFAPEVLASRCRNLLLNRRRIRRLFAESGHTAAPEEKRRELPASPAPNDVESDFYNRFTEIVRARLHDPELSIDYIAGQIGLSQSQLTRKIKAITNYTPVEIIRNMRLRHARTLLRTTEKTVGEIAFESGFTSPAYFSKCYRETFGHTPSEARR